MAIKINASRKTTIILLVVLFLIVGVSGGYLLWRVNQEKTVAPSDSEAAECNPPCGNKPDLAGFRYNQSMKNISDSSKGDQAAGYSTPSQLEIPSGVKGEIVLYYKSLEGSMQASFEIGSETFSMQGLDANRRQVVKTGIQVTGGEIFQVNSQVLNGTEKFAENCAGSNGNRYWSLGWIAPSGGKCGTTFGGPPQGGKCTPYVPADVASDISWVQATGHNIISQQCWGDWMEWKGDYDFNDYFLIIAVDEPSPPAESANIVVTKAGSSMCHNDNTANPTATLTYSIKVKNTGAGTGTISKIVDTLDSKVISSPKEISGGGIYSDGKVTWMFNPPISISAGEEIDYTYKIDVLKEKFGNYENTVVVTKGDGTTVDAKVQILCSCNIILPAELVLTKEGSSRCQNEGTENPSAILEYRVKLMNNGISSDEISKVEDTLDPKVLSTAVRNITDGGVYKDGKIIWTFNSPLSLSAGEEKILKYDVTVSKGDFGVYTNTVVATKPNGGTLKAGTTTNCTCDIYAPLCLNGILDAGEECEQGDPEGVSCLWNSCSQQSCTCLKPSEPPLTPDKVPETGLFDESENLVILGAILLFLGLGWTWLNRTYEIINGKLVERNKERFERRVVNN